MHHSGLALYIERICFTRINYACKLERLFIRLTLGILAILLNLFCGLCVFLVKSKIQEEFLLFILAISDVQVGVTSLC